MSRYTVTDSDGDYLRELPSTPGKDRVWAMDEEDAARVWADDVHADMEYPNEMDCIVTNPDGERFTVTVYAEPSVTFHASSPKPLPAPASPAGPMPNPGSSGTDTSTP